MSRSSSRAASVRHVRRAVRTLGPAPTEAPAPEVPPGEEGPGEARSSRSQSISTGEPRAAGAGGGTRRSTISLGPLRMSNASPVGESPRCPICNVVAPGLHELNVHLDEMHFGGSSSSSNGGGVGRTAAAAQDDLEEVKGAIMGFFRGAGRAGPQGPQGLNAVAAGQPARGLDAVQSSREPWSAEEARQQRNGPVRDHTRAFGHLRRRAATAAVLEGNRIEKRLERLAAVHQRVGTARAKELQAAEQAVVAWQDDAEAPECPLCGRAFGRVASRRHHCRLCGRVVCARSACSALLSIPLPGGAAEQEVRADIRACHDCEHVVLRHRDRRVRSAGPLPSELTRLYAQIRADMKQVEAALPAFNALAVRLRAGNSAPDLPRAARIRRQLTAAFGSMDHASKRISALPAAGPLATRLHTAIRRSVAQYLQLHMFPLSMLPAAKPRQPLPALRTQTAPANGSASPAGTSTASAGDTFSAADTLPEVESLTGSDILLPPPRVVESPEPAATDSPGIARTLMSYVVPAKPTAPAVTADDELVRRALEADPDKAQRIAAMPAGEKMESLDVLRDQRQRVLGFIGDAQRERRLDDAASLKASLVELDVELSLIERSL
ncbi:carboxypeptidase Y-deficient [Coemansia sp. RSA 552]|nr:carboxypeptidase Y-deficient [Coemansia sp. RSA 552]